MKLLPELTSYLEGLPEPHILFDSQYRILAANRSYLQVSTDAIAAVVNGEPVAVVPVEPS